MCLRVRPPSPTCPTLGNILCYFFPPPKIVTPSLSEGSVYSGGSQMMLMNPSPTLVNISVLFKTPKFSFNSWLIESIVWWMFSPLFQCGKLYLSLPSLLPTILYPPLWKEVERKGNLSPGLYKPRKLSFKGGGGSGSQLWLTLRRGQAGWTARGSHLIIS